MLGFPKIRLNPFPECPSMRRAIIPALILLVPLGAPGLARGQQVLVGSKKNPQVEAILAEVSPARIEATIRTLAGFGTRHTLSDPDNPTRGIGAARRWIKAELETYAKDSGGRLIVEEDDFIQPPVPRVPRPTRLVNLVATLPGDQPASRDRSSDRRISSPSCKRAGPSAHGVAGRVCCPGKS